MNGSKAWYKLRKKCKSMEIFLGLISWLCIESILITDLGIWNTLITETKKSFYSWITQSIDRWNWINANLIEYYKHFERGIAE